MQIVAKPCCRKNGGIAGLGFWSELGGAVGSFFGPAGTAIGSSVGGSLDSANTGGSAGSAGGYGGGVSVSPSISVSPQISPNFIQQQQPQNSAVNAGTLQSGSGNASTLPGQYGYGSNYPAASNMPLPTSVNAAIPTVQTEQQWTQLLSQMLPWLIGGAVLLAGIKAWKAK